MPYVHVREYAQECSEHDDCVEIVTEGRTDRHVAVEEKDDDGNVLSVFFRTELGVPTVSRSHAHRATHIACRIANDRPGCEDHTFPNAGGEPSFIAPEPMCADCHDFFHPDWPPLHRNGPVVIAAGTVEEHSGETHVDCDVCAPRAEACRKCNQLLTGGTT